MTTSAAPARRPAILIPAAGASTRMRGRDKLVETVAGRPLILDRVLTAAATGAAVIVALPPRDVAPARWAALEGAPARRVTVVAHATGMAASLTAGVAALAPDCPGVMILPADMPEVTLEDIAHMLARFDGETILRATSADGRPGHPVLFPARDFARLAALSGDLGGREVLAAARDRVRPVALPDEHALTDLDTPEDWARWRRR